MRPGTLANIPAASSPASSIVACWAKPSKASSRTLSLSPSVATLSWISFAPFWSSRPASTTASGERLGDAVHQLLVVGRVGIPDVEPGDVQPQLLGRADEGVGLAAAGRILGREEHVRAGHALVLRELGQPRALGGVVGDDPGVVAGARRIEGVGILGVAAGAVLGQADQRVARRDHRDAAVGGLVQDRDLDRGAARVVGADDADHVGVVGVGLGVLLALRPRPTRPVEAIESSQAWKATFVSPAFHSASSSTSRIASTICSERSAESPCIGRSEAIRTSASPSPAVLELGAGGVRQHLHAVVAVVVRRRRTPPAQARGPGTRAARSEASRTIA